MDYRALLVKYIAHVINDEGVDFIAGIPRDGNRLAGQILFTIDERAELDRLGADVDAVLDEARRSVLGG